MCLRERYTFCVCIIPELVGSSHVQHIPMVCGNNSRSRKHMLLETSLCVSWVFPRSNCLGQGHSGGPTPHGITSNLRTIRSHMSPLGHGALTFLHFDFPLGCLAQLFQALSCTKQAAVFSAPICLLLSYLLSRAVVAIVV